MAPSAPRPVATPAPPARGHPRPVATPRTHGPGRASEQVFLKLVCVYLLDPGDLSNQLLRLLRSPGYLCISCAVFLVRFR